MGARDLGERLFVRAVSPPRLSRATARLADWRAPAPILRALMRAYIRAYRVDMSEVAEPLSSFATFNAFFTRRLRAGARPISTEPGTVVSPSDSRLASIGMLPEDGLLEQIKGRTYSLADLLGSAPDAMVFARGVHATLYLSPSMYHRVHSPVDGVIRSWRYLPGRLFPVNTMAVRQVEGLFAVNERVCLRIDTVEFGPVAVVMVGATNVGRISLSFADLVTNEGRPAGEVTPPAPIPVARGDELGAFNLGSTVVLLVADHSLRPAGVAPGDIVRVGQPLWRRP
ncbi:MAG: phosphatidylserine decarboxylase [Acidobacteria bacterium]|nr:MAG: phosphatidylserine decarboxylase [Acidobacteriota bacterium]